MKVGIQMTEDRWQRLDDVFGFRFQVSGFEYRMSEGRWQKTDDRRRMTRLRSVRVGTSPRQADESVNKGQCTAGLTCCALKKIEQITVL